MNTKVMVSGALILFIGNLLSSFLGLVREVLLAAQYGAGMDMDSYIFANTIPSILLAFVSVVFLSSFIPLYIRERVEISEEKASLMFSNTLNWLILIILIVTAICYLFSYNLSDIFANDVSSQMKVERLMWILFPSMLFFSIAYAQSTVLNSLNHFTMPALLTVLSNIVIIVFMLLYHASLGIYAVAWGFLLGTFLQVLVQAPVLVKKGVRYRLYLGIKEKYLIKLLVLSIPVVGMVLVDQCLVFSTRFFSAHLDAGSASAINYANRIIMLPVTLFGTALVSATYPSVVRTLAEKKMNEYNAIISTSVRSLLLILAPISIISMVFAQDIIKALLQRGAFDRTDTDMTAIAFTLLSIGIMIIPIREFFTRIFFSKGNIKTPLIASILYLSCFIIGCFIMVPKLHYIGIAISTAAAMTISFFYSLITYKRLEKEYSLGISVSYFLKVLTSAALAAFIAFFFKVQCLKWFEMTETNVLLTGVCLALGMFLYLGMIKLLRIQEINFVYDKLAAKLHFKKAPEAVTISD
ncbi:murein biosynthesis integral membrane protein MurJ [Cohnella silvisoli]|uniref:Lipid II flippase n=1 Tax=Cohnella silvisoli TaxID=2873699 RepID=A0ABV1KXN9_9BACL|nr:murein biosynthesis integral membrane protein MurJ [Cohnella silvisoli]MCD9023655.1 murein biosynthesis integral membrane protein MurJ [Cohnella silvisoli]